MRLVETPSPNHGERVGDRPLDILVLHYTGMRTGAEAIARLCDPDAGVSAHYTIAEDGTVHAHVPEHRRAWHAGAGEWHGSGDINSRSIGIEIVNPGHDWGLAPFPEAQIAAVIDLGRDIVDCHLIPPGNVVGHSDIAPNRKADPGELFPWPQLARAGLGVWPGESPGQTTDDPAQVLTTLGYGVDTYGLSSCLRAFQRRFRPARIDGEADPETRRVLALVLQAAHTQAK